MTNGEKYKTAKERAEEFDRFCKRDCDCSACDECRLDFYENRIECAFAWIDLEAEEETIEDIVEEVKSHELPNV